MWLGISIIELFPAHLQIWFEGARLEPAANVLTLTTADSLARLTPFRAFHRSALIYDLNLLGLGLDFDRKKV